MTRYRPAKTEPILISVFENLPSYFSQPILSQEFEWFVEAHYHRVKECFQLYPEEMIPFEVDIHKDTVFRWERLSESQKQLLLYWFNQVMMEKVQALLLERRLGG